MLEIGIGTKSQQALKLQQEQNKQERKEKRRRSHRNRTMSFAVCLPASVRIGLQIFTMRWYCSLVKILEKNFIRRQKTVLRMQSVV